MPYKIKKMPNPHLEKDDAIVEQYESSHPYRPFSYYVLGGMDITGEHLDMSSPIAFDDQKDIDDGCGVDSLCDPKVGFFNIAEEMGVNIAEEVSQKKME